MPVLPGPVRRAALLLAVEGVALAGTGVAYGTAGVVGRPANAFATVLAAVVLVLVGVLVVVLARALDRASSWARSPVVVLQLLALPVGASLLQGRLWLPAAVVLGLSVAVLYQLATPEARLALRHEP